MIPQVIVTFSPTGQLQAEVPGPNGARQVIPLPPDQTHSTLSRLLRGQALEAAAEAWAILSAHNNHKSYDDQLDTLIQTRAKVRAAKRQYTLVESQIGVLPQVKTTQSKHRTITNSKILTALTNLL